MKDNPLHLFRVKIWVHTPGGDIIRQRYVYAYTYSDAKKYVVDWHSKLGEDVYHAAPEPVIPLEGVIL